MVPLWFMPFAMATGNTIVVKPSPRTPISQIKMVELAERRASRRRVEPGQRRDRSRDALLEHPDIQGVCFVGSTPVGREVYRKCGSHGKRVIAQGGAKNFLVVMPDADIDHTMVSLDDLLLRQRRPALPVRRQPRDRGR